MSTTEPVVAFRRTPVPAPLAALELPPMAAPLADTVASLLADPADLLALLHAAREARRTLDLLATAQRLGAIALPAELGERIARAQEAWPAAFGAAPAFA